MTPDEERELLLRYRPWLRTVAAGFPKVYPSRVEELAAEGWIAIWEALKKDKGGRPIDPFFKQCAINRMRDVFAQWIAQQRDVYRTHLADMTPGAMWCWEQFMTDSGEIEWAYHQGEVLAAVNRLPRAQRQYVTRRFWHGWAPVALDVYFTDARATWAEAKESLHEELWLIALEWMEMA